MAKYRNTKVFVDGHTFDSKKEAKRYYELRLLEKAGEIKDLRLQVKYVLIPSQRVDGKLLERECSYKADYVYVDKNNNLHVEDVKGYRKGGAYALFKVKKKLMLYVHGIIVEEI